MDSELMQEARSRPGESRRPSIVVAIPCYNEAAAIGRVVRAFRETLPEAAVWVIDNASTDGSAQEAARAGAQVIREPRRGKGYVVQTLFQTVRGDALVMVDGDGTYRAEDVRTLLAPILDGEADMVVGARLRGATEAAMGPLHHVGNRMIAALLNTLFRTSFEDVLSGYRVFSRRFQQEVPLLAQGFEVETELTVQALQRGLVTRELPVHYDPRPSGSQSKLRTFQDGYRIVVTMVVLLRDHRPIVVFGAFGVANLLAAFWAGCLRVLGHQGWLALSPSLLSGLVILCTIVGFLSIGIGLLLNVVNTRFREVTSLLTRRGEEKRPDA